MIFPTLLFPHDWKEIDSYINEDKLWKCTQCDCYTRCMVKPSPHARLIDPRNGLFYSGSISNCFSDYKTMKHRESIRIHYNTHRD